MAKVTTPYNLGDTWVQIVDATKTEFVVEVMSTIQGTHSGSGQIFYRYSVAAPLEKDGHVLDPGSSWSDPSNDSNFWVMSPSSARIMVTTK